MLHDEVIAIADDFLLPSIADIYGLQGYHLTPIRAHEGGRNALYNCEREGAPARILRICFLHDRSKEDLLAEVEYIRYLHEHGSSVANVLDSRKGNLLEEIVHRDHAFYASLFDRAKGKMLVENNYRYREGVPLTEYFGNCGKVLGRLHELSKGYTPIHRRYSFFEKYNAQFISDLVPGSLSLLKERLVDLVASLQELDMDRDSYGMVHFDYNDGNYSIDYDTGEITVYDFDNCCLCWYMYDLAGLWRSGTGWIQFEPDANKRRAFMEGYFDAVLAGYRSETSISDSMLDKLCLFIQVVLMENILDEFEVMGTNGEEPECDNVLSYYIECIEKDIPYMGFFNAIYSSDRPFQCEERMI